MMADLSALEISGIFFSFTQIVFSCDVHQIFFFILETV